MPPSVATRRPRRSASDRNLSRSRRADGEHFAELVVRNRGRDRRAARRRVLDAAEADVEVAADRGLIERGERHLDELRRAAERLRDQLGDLDVEPTTICGSFGSASTYGAPPSASPPQRSTGAGACAAIV